MASPSSRSPLSDDPGDSNRLLSRLQILAAIGCLLILVYALRFVSSGDCLRIFAVGTLVGFAALTVGFLMGFIFCIPRVDTEKQPSAAPAGRVAAQSDSALAPSNSVKQNSNLVDISDWLTKIIVGVGLVELNSIPGKLGKLSYYLGPSLRPALSDKAPSSADSVLSGQAAGLAIIAFYFALGFLWGYIWTRLHYQREIEAGEKVKALQRSNWVADLIFLAEASVTEGQLDEALLYTDQALQNDPMDGRAVLTKGRILKRKAVASGTSEADRKKLLGQAVENADRSIALLPGKAEPIYNKACYQALLGEDKNEILTTLKSALALNPGLRKVALEDSDFGALRQDNDFKQLTGDGAPPAA
ncbi:MAG: TPR end-of-group domain-containing protein [Terracidiphilus sp.]